MGNAAALVVVVLLVFVIGLFASALGMGADVSLPVAPGEIEEAGTGFFAFLNFFAPLAWVWDTLGALLAFASYGVDGVLAWPFLVLGLLLVLLLVRLVWR